MSQKLCMQMRKDYFLLVNPSEQPIMKMEQYGGEKWQQAKEEQDGNSKKKPSYNTNYAEDLVLLANRPTQAELKA